MENFFNRKLEILFVFLTFLFVLLVILAIVPNSFAISLIGFASAFMWAVTSYKSKNPIFSEFKINKKYFNFGLNLWIFLILIAVCITAWARFISPGYDLYWFSQAVTNAKMGNGLVTSSERLYPTLLVQHWETILFSVIPFTFLFKETVAVVLWQALGFWIGTWGAWKISSFLFKENTNENLKYFLTIFYAVGWATINPLSFDIHPPVFGGLLFIPWIVYFILTNKSKILITFFLILLSQCNEIFFAVVPAYFVFLILQKRISFIRIILSICVYISGFLLIALYQKYLGPWWSGLPFNYSDRYAAIGGDSLGILKTFLSNPLLVISQLFIATKIKTFLKLIIYYGFLPFIALFSNKYRLLIICIWLGCVPYLIQAGLSNYEPFFSTNTHYISALGSQWWCLSVFGIYAICEEKNRFSFLRILFQKKLILPVFLTLFFLNSSEWRKSPIYPFRGLIEREKVDNEVRNYFNLLPKSKGVLFFGTEWLCPLAAIERKHVLCEGGANFFLPTMNLDVIVSNPNSLKALYNSLSEEAKNSVNGKAISGIINNELDNIKWKKIFIKTQKKHRNEFVDYSIWQKQE